MSRKSGLEEGIFHNAEEALNEDFKFLDRLHSAYDDSSAIRRATWKA